MAPTCGPFGPMGRFVKHVTPDAWQRSYDLAAPHGKFCGVVAQFQFRKGFHFMCEQPSGSDLYYEHHWLAVLYHASVYQQRYDRCMAGFKAQYGPYKGAFIKKASTMTASNIRPSSNHLGNFNAGAIMPICKCMVRVKTCPHAKYGHGMKLIVSPTAYIDSRKSSWHSPQPVYKPILDKKWTTPTRS